MYIFFKSNHFRFDFFRVIVRLFEKSVYKLILNYLARYLQAKLEKFKLTVTMKHKLVYYKYICIIWFQETMISNRLAKRWFVFILMSRLTHYYTCTYNYQ